VCQLTTWQRQRAPLLARVAATNAKSSLTNSGGPRSRPKTADHIRSFQAGVYLNATSGFPSRIAYGTSGRAEENSQRVSSPAA